MNVKVLMFGWEFPPNITGGLGTACYGLTKGLLELGTGVLFMVPRKFGNEDPSVDIIDASNLRIAQKEHLLKTFKGRYSVQELDSPLSPYLAEEEYWAQAHSAQTLSSKAHPLLTSHYQFPGKYGKNLFEEVHRYAHLAAAVSKSETFDVIHAHDWPVYPAGIMAKDHSGKPLIVHVHATEFDRSGQKVNSRIYDIEKLGMEKADKVIAVSQFTKNIIVNNYGISPTKVEVVHNAVDHQAFKKIDAAKTSKIVTFLGRITFQKGPDYFVKAAKLVLERMDNVRFVMAGSGDMFTALLHHATDLGISSHFHFTGFLDKDEVNHLLSISDLYVMPSVSEPFGLSALEALKANVPVIISRQSGVSEILKNVSKVDFWDIEELANTIYGILQYPSLAENICEGGSQEIRGLDWNDSAEKIKQIYLALVAQNT